MIWKINALLNLINCMLHIDQIYLYAKDPYEAKYQFLIKNQENTGLKHYDDSKFDYSNDMEHIYENIEEYNWNKQRKILILFYKIFADMLNNKSPNPIISQLYIKVEKRTFLLFL